MPEGRGFTPLSVKGLHPGPGRGVDGGKGHGKHLLKVDTPMVSPAPEKRKQRSVEWNKPPAAVPQVAV